MKVLMGMVAAATSLLLPNLAMAATQYEAENATRSGGANVNTNHPGYTGTGFVDGYFFSASAQTVFTVSASSAGSATITTRYSAGNGTSTNTGFYVNGTKIKNITFNATSNWDTWATQIETVSLNAGNNTIAYKAETSSGSCINLDNIVYQGATTTYSLTVVAGTGGTRTAPATSPITVNHGAATTIAASPNSGYAFANWTVTSGTASIANPASASTTVSLTSNNASVQANFTPVAVTYLLTVANDGHGTTLPSGTVTVTAGAANSIVATAASGYQFLNWTVTAGTPTIASATSAGTTVTLTGNASIRANFTATPPSVVNAVTYAQISSPVTVTGANTVVLALPFTAPSTGHITVTVTGLYGTNNTYTHEQRGLESFITLNSTSGGSLSGYSEKATLNSSAQYVSETEGFPVTAGSNIVRLVVTPRTTLTKTQYSFSKCKMTVVFSPQKL